MNSYTELYLKQIYPMQDLVLQTVQNCSNLFYLTGGTALNRAFVNVRFSDDLDFFVNDCKDFATYVNNVVEKIVSIGFDFKEKDLTVTDNFVGMFLSHNNFDANLKIDFVNDIPTYFGKQIKTEIFDRTDCIENILSNKLSTVIGRSEIKDVVDLLSISKNYQFSWNEALLNAEKKEATVDASLIAGILYEITEAEFDKIKWIEKPKFEIFKNEVSTMARDILCLNNNSLCTINH